MQRRKIIVVELQTTDLFFVLQIILVLPLATVPRLVHIRVVRATSNTSAQLQIGLTRFRLGKFLQYEETSETRDTVDRTFENL